MSCHPPARQVGPFRPEDGLTTGEQNSWPYTDLHVKPYAERHVKVYADSERLDPLAPPREQCDPGATAGERARGRLPDPARGAGNDADAAAQPTLHAPQVPTPALRQNAATARR